MKLLHRPDMYCWSRFDEARDIDFHSYVWVREAGNVVIDPLPLTDHDREHLTRLGGVSLIVVTNSDHRRDAEALATRFGAEVAGPAGERDGLGIACDRWLAEGDQVVLGMTALEMRGSKTEGELALLLEGTTLVTGDLVRAHAAGALTLLPDAKLRDRAAAVDSVRRLAELEGIETVLVGDGWPVFREGGRVLRELLERL